MNAEQFVWWLNGFLETANPKEINEEQTQIIKDHLALVFNKVTPDYRYIKPNFDSTGVPPYQGETDPFRVICGITLF